MSSSHGTLLPSFSKRHAGQDDGQRLFFGQPVVKAYVSGAIKLDAKVGQRTCIYTPYIGSRAVQKNMFADICVQF